MEKQVIIGILAIVAISICAVLINDSSSITGLGGYGYASKIYGPALKNAYKTPAVFGKGFAEALIIQRSQEYMLRNRDKWTCGFKTSDGPFPCMQEDASKGWCCLLPPGVTMEQVTEPTAVKIPGARFPQYIADDYKPKYRPETKLTGVVPKN
ncbi:MAG: hypothetical protein QW165_04145 [Candidatus Woesearchaeota archaeon]